MFPYDESLHKWVRHALPVAEAELQKSENEEWVRCGGSWFVGVNALPNDGYGRLKNGPPLEGVSIDFVEQEIGLSHITWDRSQISVCYPGYPKRMEDESISGFNYRVKRDAAHVDGFRPEGPGRRRYLLEHHQFVLGIPMKNTFEDASPLVLWEGSHHAVKKAFESRFKGIAPQSWWQEDVTQAYVEVRNTIFESCDRIEITAQPGEAYLIHRLALHGIAPWQNTTLSEDEGRMVCYFRPPASEPQDWLLFP